MKRTRAFLTVALLLVLVPTAAVAQHDQARKLRVARLVYDELMEVPDRAAPEWMERKARCIAVFPGVIKGALMWGGRHGKGVMSCRHDGGWSPPVFLKISGGSFGLQAGGESSDLVLFFLKERGVRSLLRSKWVLGADGSVAAGPVGRTAETGTDVRLNAEIFAYARTRGLFAGLSVEGARLAPDQKAIRRYYGQRLWPERILFDAEVPRLPPEAESFMGTLP